MGFQKVEAANYWSKIANCFDSRAVRELIVTTATVAIGFSPFGLRKTRVFPLYHKALIAWCEVCRRFDKILACDSRTCRLKAIAYYATLAQSRAAKITKLPICCMLRSALQIKHPYSQSKRAFRYNYSVTRTVGRACCKDDDESLWGMAKFDPPHRP